MFENKMVKSKYWIMQIAWLEFCPHYRENYDGEFTLLGTKILIRSSYIKIYI